MKKGKKIGLGIAIVFLVILTSLIIWQWNNLKAFYIGITYSDEKIEKKIEKSKEKLAEKLEKEGIVNEKIVTGFSKEDEAKLKKGELSVEEAVEKLFATEETADNNDEVSSSSGKVKVSGEKNVESTPENSAKTEETSTVASNPKDSSKPKNDPKGTEENKDTVNKENNSDTRVVSDSKSEEKDTNVSDNSTKQTTQKPSAQTNSDKASSGNVAEDKEEPDDKNEDSTSSQPSSKDLIEGAVKEMYTLKARFVQQLATIERNAKRVYIKGEMNMDSKLKIADMFMPQFVAAEKDCDTQVEKVLGTLKTNLEAIGADTSVVQSIREQYNNEKELQKSKYINEYL